MKAAVIQFPGSNCDFDMYYALQDFGADVQFVTEKATDLSAYDAVLGITCGQERSRVSRP